MACEFMPEDYFAVVNGESIFGNDQPLEIDLGCGDGKFLLEMAQQYPIHLLCPDPWPKERHHKRRLLQVSFFQALEKVIQTEGEFCFKTDHTGYYEWACEHAEEYGRFIQLPWEEDAFFYPKTDFQLQWEGQGKEIHRLRFKNPH